MMNEIIGKLCESGQRVHVACSGAGSLIQHELWERPGASAWFSGATFPYDQDETADYLGFRPEKFCCSETAVHLAAAAYMSTFKFGQDAVGLGLTASVASNREHRGDHRVFACAITKNACYTLNFVLQKGVGQEQRNADNISCSRAAEKLLLAVIRNPQILDSHSEYSDHELHGVEFFPNNELLKLMMQRPVFTESGARVTKLTGRRAIMPGAYNPPHYGHLNAADAVTESHGYLVAHQITIDPPHKSPLRAQEILERAKMLKGRCVIFTQGDPYYIHKAKQFPGTPIVMGADALARMFDPRWELSAQHQVDEFNKHGTKIFVFTRVVDGTLHTLQSALSNVDIERDIFVEIDGRWDISSTELRAKLT